MASILRASISLPPPGERTSRLTYAQRRFRGLTPRQRRPPGLSYQLKIAPFPRKAHPFSTVHTWASYGEATETDQVENTAEIEDEYEGETKTQKEAANGGIVDAEEKTNSALAALLLSYKEALANDDQTTVADVENFLLSLESEKEPIAKKVALLSEELSAEKERILRISADFDNFRKRTERERLSLMTNVQGELIESLLPVLDNFERAKAQIKLETEGEEKINNSYQSIYKQFIEIMNSLGVETVETVGCAFDPTLHEAIMQEESTEFDEGIILLEFRKGFKLGDRLLRPSMVKVSSGPGPQKSEASTPAEEAKGNDEPISADPEGGESA